MKKIFFRILALFHNLFYKSFKKFKNLIENVPEVEKLFSELTYNYHCQRKLGLKFTVKCRYASYLRHSHTSQFNFLLAKN